MGRIEFGEHIVADPHGGASGYLLNHDVLAIEGVDGDTRAIEQCCADEYSAGCCENQDCGEPLS
jgi:hypothetical protein